MTTTQALQAVENTRTRETTRSPDTLPLEVVDRTDPPRPRGMWKIYAALVVLAAVAGLGSAGWYFQNEIADWIVGNSPAEQVATVEPVEDSVFALGRLEPQGETISVAAPSGAAGAVIAELHVAQGDRVKAGDLLAKLDNATRLESARLLAESQVKQAEARLAQTRHTVESTRLELQAAVESAEAKLATARVKHDWRVSLYNENAASEEELRDAQLNLRQAEQAVRESQARLQRYASSAEGVSVDVAVAKDDLNVAQATLQQAVANLSDAEIRAPRDGVILDILARPGESLGQKPLLEMGDTQHMYARVEVYESDVHKIKPGDPVRFYSTALTDDVRGEVVQISSLVRRQSVVDSDPAANTDARVVEVLVRLDAESSQVASTFVGLQVQAEFSSTFTIVDEARVDEGGVK